MMNRNLLTACIAATVAGTPMAAAQMQGRTDEQVEMAARTELRLEESVPAHKIGVDVDDGVATLDGSVSTLLAKEAAAKAARDVRGVTSVINLIDVTPPARDDSDVREDVKNALLADPATDSYELRVTVNDGKVTLHGEVESWQEKRLAALVAKGVRGVRGVTNKIEVDYVSDRPDAEIRAEVRRAIQAAAGLHVYDLKVRVDDGDVRLSGTAASASERWEAHRRAWVAGVDSVDSSGITVEPWAAPAMTRPHLVERTDAQIERAVEEALSLDPRVFSFDVDATVNNGIVTLSGTVTDLAAKMEAESDAAAIAGVRRVRNFIDVRPAGEVTDERLESRVDSSLLRDPYVNRYDITVEAENGRVTLWGDVDSEFEMNRATTVASRVQGVSAVENNLVVHDEWTRAEDWEIKDDIDSQLFWSPFVDSDDVTVTVRDGVATLTGTVSSWHERRAATENALEGGARRVDNDLIVSAED